MMQPAALTPQVAAPECATETQSARMTPEAPGDQVSADAAQSSILRPPMRLNSRVFWVTRVASSASAWDAIHRSLAPIGVPLSLQARHGVNAYPSGQARLLSRRLRVTPRHLFLLAGRDRPLSASLRALRFPMRVAGSGRVETAIGRARYRTSTRHPTTMSRNVSIAARSTATGSGLDPIGEHDRVPALLASTAFRG